MNNTTPSGADARDLLLTFQSWIGPRRPERGNPDEQRLWDRIDAAIAALSAAQEAPARHNSIDVEALIAACLPGGQSCDPQQVADDIRRYCNAWPGDGSPAQAVQAVPEIEPCRPDILEKLTYHALERDDLTLDDCLSYLAEGWRKVRGRTKREMVLQLTSLLAAAPAAPQPAAQPVAVLRFERGASGCENEMPRVVSCNRLPDGEYAVFLAAQPAAQQGEIAWPEMPPRKGQSPVLFEDGYDEGWAKCLEACKAALAAQAQEAAPAAQGEPSGARDEGFNCGVCLALQVITGCGNVGNNEWDELLKSAGREQIEYHAKHVDPDMWELAGFAHIERQEQADRDELEDAARWAAQQKGGAE